MRFTPNAFVIVNTTILVMTTDHARMMLYAGVRGSVIGSGTQPDHYQVMLEPDRRNVVEVPEKYLDYDLVAEFSVAVSKLIED